MSVTKITYTERHNVPHKLMVRTRVELWEGSQQCSIIEMTQTCNRTPYARFSTVMQQTNMVKHGDMYPVEPVMLEVVSHEYGDAEQTSDAMLVAYSIRSKLGQYKTYPCISGVEAIHHRLKY